jgi:hypothetical protein
MAPMAMATAACDFPTPGGPMSKTFAVFGDEATGRQLEELGPWELGIESPVEVGELLHLRDRRLLQPALEQAVGTSGELVLDQKLEKLHRVEPRGARLLNAPRKSVDKAGEAQMA